MPTATHRLHIRRLDTIGFVDKGDDPLAEVLIAKRVLKKVERRGDKWVVLSEDGGVLGTHDTKPEAEAQLRAVEANKKARDPNENGGRAMAFDVKNLEDEAQAEFEKLTDRISDLEEELAAKKEDPPADPDVSPEIQKQLDAAAEEVRKANERVQKLEDEREHQRFIGVAKTLGFNQDDWAVPLRKIHGALEDDEWKRFEEHEKSMRAQLKEAALYKRVGLSGSGAATEAEQELHAAVTELKKQHPDWRPERLEGEVMKNDVQLRNRLEAERLARTPQPNEED